MGFKHVTAKLGNMRKPQTFVVTLSDKGNFIIQSDKSIGRFDMISGEGVLNTKGSYFVHLSPSLGAVPYTFPQELVSECCAAFPLSHDVIGATAETGIVYYGGTHEIGDEKLPEVSYTLALLYSITPLGLNGFEIIIGNESRKKFAVSGSRKANFLSAVAWAERHTPQIDYIA